MTRIPLSPLLLAIGCGHESAIQRLKQLPEVIISSPAPDTVFAQGEGVLEFEGLVTDSYDKPDMLSAWWVVDGEEREIGLAEDGSVRLALDPEPLALGRHLLGLRALDSDGDEAYAELAWALRGPFGLPTVLITAPADTAEFPLGEEVIFQGEAQDSSTPSGELVFSWTSSLDGPLDGAISADGRSVLIANALSAGAHTITLSVADTDGETGEDQIAVLVVEEPPPPDPPVEALPGDFVFSELQVNPEAVDDLQGEWVELYNTSSSPIDLAGYSFHDLGIDSYVLGSVLADPQSYIVLCANLDSALNGGVPCDGFFLRSEYGGTGSMALGNNGDEVVLSRPDGVVIDEVAYDGSWFTPGVATGLDPTQLDADNNDDETMWCDQETVLPGADERGTPGQPNDPC